MHGFTWKQIRNLFRFGLHRLSEGRLPQVAGSLTFTTVLAVVPILTVAFAIFTAFPLFNTFRASIEAYFVQNLMPKGIANTILNYLTQFSSKATRLSAVGGLVLMLTAIATMATVDKVFNQIWQVKRKRPFFQRILVYWAIITLGPLLIGISISSTTFLFAATKGVAKSLPFVGEIFYTLLSIGITGLAYTLLYLAVPNRTVARRDAAIGALVAACAFEIAKRVFASFITQFPSYTVVYGALAAVPIFLLWIYLSWLITLIGAVIAAALPIIKHERWWHMPTPGSAIEDAMLILEVLFSARNTASISLVDVQEVRAKTHLGMDEIDNLLQRMAELGWVARAMQDSSKQFKAFWKKSGEADCWTLIIHPEQLRLLDIYRIFVFEPRARSHLSELVMAGMETGLQMSLQEYFLKKTVHEI